MDSHLLSRRAALKTFGVGAALLGLGLKTGRASGATKTEAGGTLQPFSLPELGYDYAALEPHFDAETMRIHHTRHHQAYINNANQALSGHPALQRLTAEALVGDLTAVPGEIRTAVRNNVGGHLNHALFWQILSPQGGGAPEGELGAAITQAFGSFNEFKARFADAAMRRFGSGWAWLSLKDGALMVHSTANQDSPLMEGAVPLLGLDVWEHAYYLHYQNRRADFVAAFWSLVDWQRVGLLYKTAGPRGSKAV